MGILEDRQNLNLAGRITCLGVFLLGLVELAAITSRLSDARAFTEEIRKKTAALQMLPPNPEETASEFSPIQPQTQEERETRAIAVRQQLSDIFAQLPPNSNRNSKKILIRGVETGTIHPNQARQIWEEMMLVAKPPANPKKAEP